MDGMLAALMVMVAHADTPDTAALRRAHRSAQRADCGPALALSNVVDAPETRHRALAAQAQVRCATVMRNPANPVDFYAEPLSSAVLVNPVLQRELTMSVIISSQPIVSRAQTTPSRAAAVHERLQQARTLDPSHWLIWQTSLLAVTAQMDGALAVEDTRQLMDVWSQQPASAGAVVLAEHCSLVGRDDLLWRTPPVDGQAILTACVSLFAEEVARTADSRGVLAGYLVVLETAAAHEDPSLRTPARDALRRWAPDSALVGLFDAEDAEQAGDMSAAASHYQRVAATMPDLLVAHLGAGRLLGEQALARFDGQPPEDAGEQARVAMGHLEIAFGHADIAPADRIAVARLMVQLCDRIEDAEAEAQWRAAYSTAVLGR